MLRLKREQVEVDDAITLIVLVRPLRAPDRLEIFRTASPNWDEPEFSRKQCVSASISQLVVVPVRTKYGKCLDVIMGHIFPEYVIVQHLRFMEDRV